ncbi:MAG: hypothetical protein NXI14_15435 [bacterium]|nr:hypothetical protein [bacterium]
MHRHTGSVVALLAGGSIEMIDRDAIAWCLRENPNAHKLGQKWLPGARQTWASASPRRRERLRADLAELVAPEALKEIGQLIERVVAIFGEKVYWEYLFSQTP